MDLKPAANVSPARQMSLGLDRANLSAMAPETEQGLIAALADLLLAVAIHNHRVVEENVDEHENK